ncbi:hypothetical protein Gohar_015204 [Gossypium harknessii]|uniref:Uncharacterized protein n=1 Tax=Gossypium harknessii TaxID=34285 RepID=A0A7J9G068_9ROSI|nr:hypothetical protein [Gossypium harknessii]MBA0790564.1 hypothetical protein [Gossypium harknessii]
MQEGIWKENMLLLTFTKLLILQITLMEVM